MTEIPEGWDYASEGIRRRVLEHTPDMMLVAVHFEQGASAPAHEHPHVQATYVLSGKFEFIIGGEVKTVTAGDTLMIPGNTVHSGVSLEAGELIDCFTPRRDDFL
jgi:quercetin dioxygenase-like cupin family protein